MNQTIRSRIEQIKRGEITEGYEKTPFGIFPCDWEKSTLKKLGEFAKGKGIPGEKMKNEGIPCVGYGDIYMKYNYHFNQAKSFIDRTTADESIQVGRNTLLFTGTGETAEEIGKCVCYTGSDDIYVGGDIIIFNSVDVSPIFISYQQYLPFAIKQKAGFGQGHSVVHIYKSDLEKLYCAYPKSKAEQEKIAEILQEQDRLIELKEKLIEEKKKQKQYLMDVLLTGKVRLPGFSYEWQSFRLGDICIIKKGEQLNKNCLLSEGEFAVINGGTTASGYYDMFNRDENTISISEGGNSCGYIAFNENKFWSGGHCYTLHEINMQIDLFYLFYYLKSHEKEIMDLRVGSGLPNIQLSAIKNFIVQAPNRRVQEKIAEILNSINSLILSLQKELEEQKRKKQSLMQLLLTGIVRVKA